MDPIIHKETLYSHRNLHKGVEPMISEKLGKGSLEIPTFEHKSFFTCVM